MNGYDIQQYEHLKIRANENNMLVYTYGEKVGLKSSFNEEWFGFFVSISETLSFIYGYELGLRKGRLSTQKEE